jgi:hypothetical protein
MPRRAIRLEHSRAHLRQFAIEPRLFLQSIQGRKLCQHQRTLSLIKNGIPIRLLGCRKETEPISLNERRLGLFLGVAAEQLGIGRHGGSIL